MKPMPRDEWRAFLSSGTRTAKLATLRPDGRPHVAAVWFVLDGEDLLFTTHRDTVKGKNLAANPKVMLCVDDEQPPFAFVAIESVAATSALPPDRLIELTTRIAARYVGTDQADAYGRRNAVDGELLVRVPLVKVTARRGIADW